MVLLSVLSVVVLSSVLASSPQVKPLLVVPDRLSLPASQVIVVSDSTVESAAVQ